MNLLGSSESSEGNWFTELISDVWTEKGLAAVLLVVVCMLFYKLIWKVWLAAMRAKDQEIERLVTQRDRYQELVFEKLLHSKPNGSKSDQTNGNNDETDRGQE